MILDKIHEKKFFNFESLFSNHLITTSDFGGINVNEKKINLNGNRKIIESFFSNKSFVTTKAQHGAEIKIINKKTDNQVFSCDGLIYIHHIKDPSPEKIICATTGDCPYLLIEAINHSYRLVSLVHSGWRGIEKNIAGLTIQKIAKIGFKKENIHIELWSGICGNCYEVESDVRKALSDYHKFFIPNGRKKWNLDLAGIIKKQLTYEGISELQMEYF